MIIGNFAQSSVVQELVHGRMTQAMRQEGLEPANETSAARNGMVWAKKRVFFGVPRAEMLLRPFDFSSDSLP